MNKFKPLKMKSTRTEVNEEIIVKKEYQPFVITETSLGSVSSFSYSSSTKVHVKDPNGEINGIEFSIQGSIAGCGLCTLHGITNLNLNTKEKQQAFKRVLEQLLTQSNVRSTTQQKGCVIATLGETYVKNFEPMLLGAGFIKVHTYDNIAHGIANDRYQSIYLLDIKRK